MIEDRHPRLVLLAERIDYPLQCIYAICMKQIQFEWDENKNDINQRKHKVSFEEAKTVFFDPEALLIHDPDYSENDEVIRIISARKADKDEIKNYGG